MFYLEHHFTCKLKLLRFSSPQGSTVKVVSVRVARETPESSEATPDVSFSFSQRCHLLVACDVASTGSVNW